MDLKKNPSVDLIRNSGLYFAIGLNVMLFLTWKALDYKTYDTVAVSQSVLQVSDEFEEDIPITNIDFKPPPPPVASVAPEVITIVEDEVEVEESLIESTEIGQDDEIAEAIAVEEIEVMEEEEEISVPFTAVENVPVFPGCKGSNDELKKCFNSKMFEHVRKNFKYPEIAQELEIHGKVFVFFEINSNGLVANIRARGPDKSLENEAKRIIGLLPKMLPGKQRGKSVRVPYSVPISFQLQE